MSAPALSVLRRLDVFLQDTPVEAELLLVGGAVVTVVFNHAPGSRRPALLFGDPEELERATATIASENGLPGDWLTSAVRSLVGERGERYSWQGERLSVYAPRPEYVMALKCAELRFAAEDRRRAVETDLRYLLRLLELRAVDDVLLEAGRFFSARQLGPEVGERIGALLA